MSPSQLESHPELQSRIISFIRAGGYPHVAAEAAGVSRRTFQRWLQRGRRRGAQPPYRGFAQEVRQAAAQALLRAEIAIFEKRPLDWLKCGPGKETSAAPGWSAAPRAQAASSGRGGNPLTDRRLLGLIRAMQQALTPFPEAQAALIEVAAQLCRHPSAVRE